MGSCKVEGEEAVSFRDDAVKMLKSLIPDVIEKHKRFDCNVHLYRWLLAHNFNPKKTESAIRKSVEWRLKNGLDLDWDDEEFLKFKSEFCPVFGTHKSTYPVMYYDVGSKDFRAVITSYGRKKYVHYWAKMLIILEGELAEIVKNNVLAKDGKTYDKYQEIFITNCKDFSAYQIASLDVLRVTTDILTIATSYLPATFDSIVFINANPVFKGLFSLLKPILTFSFRNLEVFGSDEKKWSRRLLQVLEKEQIEEFLEI